MPTPIGHAVGGALFGGLVTDTRASAAAQPRWGQTWRAQAALFAVVGVLPDLDLLLGLHSRYSHSIGAACAAGLVGWFVARRRGRWGLAIGVAYASHVLLDWLGNDTSDPIGIMALWPFSDAFYQSDEHLLMAVSRRYWLSEFWAYNLRVVAWELLLLAPPTLALWWWRWRTVEREPVLSSSTRRL